MIGAELAFVVRAVGELGRGVASEPRVGGLAELDAVEAGNQPRGGQRFEPAAVVCRGSAAGDLRPRAGERGVWLAARALRRARAGTQVAEADVARSGGARIRAAR